MVVSHVENKELKNYELLKVSTTMLVVLAHVTRMYTGVGVVTPINSSMILDYVTKFIYSFHMPLFVFIAGSIYSYLRYNKGRYNDAKGFFVSKAKRLLLPYIVFGLFYVAPVMTYFGFSNIDFLKYVLNGIILSDNSRHLWFLLTLFNIFTIVYFTDRFINRLPTAIVLIVFYLVYSISSMVPHVFQLKGTASYLIYFYLGYLFQTNIKTVTQRLRFDTKTFLISFGLHLITFSISLYLHPKGPMFHAITLFSALLGITSAYSLVNLLPYSKISASKLYSSLKRDSFGIYLFHPMIIYVLFFYLDKLKINPFLLTGLIFSITMILSTVFTVALRIIGLNIILGENKNKRTKWGVRHAV